MRPNEMGGQTLENHYEIESASAALAANHHEDIALWLHIAPSSSARSNLFPELQTEHERVIELNYTDSKLAISSLRKAAEARVNVEKSDMWMAQSMIAKLDGKQFKPKSHRIRRALAKLKK
jgi:hypothetical protein